MLISVLAFLGGALGLSAVFRKRFELTIPVFCLLSVFVLYFFGIFGGLVYGVYTVYGLGILGLLSAVFFAIKNKTFTFNPGILVFLFFMVLAWWAQKGRLLSSFDEFTHWGLTVKNIYYFDRLPNHAASSVRFPGYPPGTALLQYFFVKGTGAYSDAAIFSAHNVLYYCLMMPLFQDIKKKGLFKTLIAVALVLIVPIVFYADFFTEIYVDAMLGILLAYSLITYFVSEHDVFKTLNISLVLFVLCITKASGKGLAILALLIMLMDGLRFKRETFEPYKQSAVKKACRILCPVLSVLVAAYSWKIYLAVTGTSGPWDTSGVTLKAITDVFALGRGSETHMTIIGNFIKAFFEEYTTSFNFVVSLAGSLAVLALLYFGYATTAANKQGIRRFYAFSLSIFTGFFIYAFSLLTLYLFAFSVYEGTLLASFERYVGTYLIAIFVFIISLIIIKDTDRKKRNALSVLVTLLLIITVNLQPLLDITILRSASVKIAADKVTSMNGIVKVQQYADIDDKTYIVNPDGTAYEFYLSNYYITPYQAGRVPWSFGAVPYSDEDRYFEAVSADEWEQTLYQDFQFVYVYDTCGQFELAYGQLFENQSVKPQTVYRVEKADGKVLLVEAG